VVEPTCLKNMRKSNFIISPRDPGENKKIFETTTQVQDENFNHISKSSFFFAPCGSAEISSFQVTSVSTLGITFSGSGGSGLEEDLDPTREDLEGLFLGGEVFRPEQRGVAEV